MRRRILEGTAESRVADQELRVRLLVRAARPASGQQDLVSTTEVALSGVTATESDALERHCARRAGSSRPRPPRRRRAAGRSCRRSALRAHSIDGIGATSTSPASRRPRELGRDAADLLHLGVEPVEDRRHVHVGDSAEADHGPLHAALVDGYLRARASTAGVSRPRPCTR